MVNQPQSEAEFNHRAEQHERRAEALNRYRRQQFELFEMESDYPECPNCGEHAKPLSGVSHDEGTGYSSEELGCMACVRRQA